jgi:hypothetical protein
MIDYRQKKLDNLRKRFPQMTEEEAIVCREIHSTWEDHGLTHYEEVMIRLSPIKDHNGHSVEAPVGSKEWWNIKRAIYRAHRKGYANYALHEWGNPVTEYVQPVIDLELDNEVWAELEKVSKEECDSIPWRLVTEEEANDIDRRIDL